MGKNLELCCLDRRRFPRFPCTGAAEILQNGKRWGWGTVSDISRGGCYIETLHPLPTSTEAELRLTIAGILVEIPANVVSSDPMFGMGMDFIVVPAEAWDKLPQIIEKVGIDLSPSVQQIEASIEAAHPQMQAALQHLEQAQKKLQEAMHGTEGQWALAVQLTENTINAVKKACKQGSANETSDSACIGSGPRVEMWSAIR